MTFYTLIKFVTVSLGLTLLLFLQRMQFLPMELSVSAAGDASCVSTCASSSSSSNLWLLLLNCPSPSPSSCYSAAGNNKLVDLINNKDANNASLESSSSDTLESAMESLTLGGHRVMFILFSAFTLCLQYVTRLFMLSCIGIVLGLRLEAFLLANQGAGRNVLIVARRLACIPVVRGVISSVSSSSDSPLSSSIWAWRAMPVYACASAA